MSIQYMNIHGERLAVEDKELRDNVGDVNLLMTNKKNVVDAINEMVVGSGATLEVSYDSGSNTVTIVDSRSVQNG